MTNTETTKIFQERFEDLYNKYKHENDLTYSKLEESTGISRAALTKYLNDNAEIGINNLVKIARFFNVSTDFLLGLSDVMTTDTDVKMICDYTGLSEMAVNNLLDISYEKNELKDNIHRLDSSVYNLKKNTLFLVNFILEDRVALNTMAINFNGYFSLLSDRDYDCNIFDLNDGLKWITAERALKDTGLHAIPKEDMLDYRFYSFIKCFTDVVKMKAEKKAKFDGE